MLVELGVPVALAATAYYRPQLRRRLAPIGGSVLPFLVAYLATWVGWLSGDRSPESSFGVYAMWLMSFIPYLIALTIGAALGFARRPESLVWRFGAGAFLAPAVIGMLLLMEGSW